ncbi:hypothetical protein B0A55_10640, partial [Friedmanniomyces simplex]
MGGDSKMSSIQESEEVTRQVNHDHVSERNNNFMDGESKPGLAMTANIYTIIAAIAQLAAIAVGSELRHCMQFTPTQSTHQYKNANSARELYPEKMVRSTEDTTVQALIGVPNIAYSLSFQPVPTIITLKAATRGGNSLGLTAADGSLFNLLLTVSWDTQADDALIDQQAKALFDQSETMAKQMGLYNEYLCLNYAAPWQDPISGCDAAVKAQLQAVSKMYDPRGVFQTQCR